MSSAQWVVGSNPEKGKIVCAPSNYAPLAFAVNTGAEKNKVLGSFSFIKKTKNLS